MPADMIDGGSDGQGDIIATGMRLADRRRFAKLGKR